MSEPGFWDDPNKARRTVQQMKFLRGRVGPAARLVSDSDDLKELLEQRSAFTRGVRASKLPL